MWALPVEGGYRVSNIPFYACGVAFGDIVAICEAPDGMLEFDHVVHRGGHSTYRVLIRQPQAGDPGKTISEFEALGLGVEMDLANLLALDVPPEADIETVHSKLFDGVDSGRWEVEEGHRATT